MAINKRDANAKYDAGLATAIALDEIEAHKVIHGTNEDGSLNEAEVVVVAPATSAEDALSAHGELSSDFDVTHTDEDDDPESNIGEEVDYDLGSDDEE